MERTGLSLTEIKVDGIVGPSHNYAGLSLGNLAATAHAGEVSYPCAAALQGLAKMRGNLARGLTQGFFVPLPRPNPRWLEAISADAATDPGLLAAAWSASSMWTANAATVSPAPDTADGRGHLTAANLVTMPHRSHEWPDTLAQLELRFADTAHFAVHGPVPPTPARTSIWSPPLWVWAPPGGMQRRAAPSMASPAIRGPPRLPRRRSKRLE